VFPLSHCGALQFVRRYAGALRFSYELEKLNMDFGSQRKWDKNIFSGHLKIDNKLFYNKIGRKEGTRDFTNKMISTPRCRIWK